MPLVSNPSCSVVFFVLDHIKRSCGLAPAHQGMKIGAPVSGREKRGTSPRAALPVPTLANLWDDRNIHVATFGDTSAAGDPGSESGTCFRTKEL